MEQLGYQTYKRTIVTDTKTIRKVIWKALSNETKLENLANRLDQANLIHIGDFNCLVVLSQGVSNLEGRNSWNV